MSDEDLARDLDGIKNPNSWPLWPVLPLKKRRSTGLPEVAYLYADDITTVRVGNILQMSDSDPEIKYLSVEDLLHEWMVD